MSLFSVFISHMALLAVACLIAVIVGTALLHVRYSLRAYRRKADDGAVHTSETALDHSHGAQALGSSFNTLPDLPGRTFPVGTKPRTSIWARELCACKSIHLLPKESAHAITNG